MAIWPFPTGYPTALDNFLVAQIDNVDIVWANHPNSLASAVMALQSKLNIDNLPIQGVGGLEFDPIGVAANPGAPGNPTIWSDNSGGAGFPLYYTDDLGNTYDLRNTGSTGLGYTCPAGTALGEMVSISAADTVVLSDATTALKAHGIVINVYGGGTSCDVVYRAEVAGFVGLTSGAEYYLGDAGVFVLEGAIPGTATLKQAIGYARNTTTLVFNPTLETGV